MTVASTTRRKFLRRAASSVVLAASPSLISGCAAWTWGPGKPMARLGFLALTTLDDYAPYLDALRAGLSELGYVEGQNVSLDYRFANGHEEQLPHLAAELVSLGVDLILAAATQANQAAVEATQTIPIVMTNSGDPVGAGLVESLAHPGRNLTGLTSLNRELAAKRLELLTLTVPQLTDVGVLWNDTSYGDFDETRNTAELLGISIHSLHVQRSEDVPAALESSRERVNGLIAISTPVINAQREAIAGFGLQHRMPAVSEQRQFVEAGGLMAYGANVVALYHRAANFVDKILRGARPSDLPIERAQHFDLVLNMSTARKLGVVVPEPVLLQMTDTLV